MNLKVNLALAAGCLIGANMLALPALASAAAPSLEFGGARLGMSQAAWKAAQPPGRTSAHTRALCSDDPDIARPKRTLSETRAGVVVCAYVNTYGKFSLPVRFPFDKAYTIDHLRFWFVRGRLAEIHAAAPLAAYGALVADFTQRYGPSTSLVRDSVPSEAGALPRIRQVWSTQVGLVELVDPILPSDEIGLRLVAGGLTPLSSGDAQGRPGSDRDGI